MGSYTHIEFNIAVPLGNVLDHRRLRGPPPDHLQLHGTLTSTSRTFAISLDSLPVHLDQLKHCCSQFNLYCFCPLFQAGNERHGLNLKVLGLERVFLPLLRRLWPSMAHKGGAIFGWALSCIFNISVSLHEPSLLFQ